MIATDKLRGLIVERGMSQKEIAKRLGISEITFYRKMKKAVFNSDEIEKMILLLEIDEPKDFFWPDSNLKAT